MISNLLLVRNLIIHLAVVKMKVSSRLANTKTLPKYTFLQWIRGNKGFCKVKNTEFLLESFIAGNALERVQRVHEPADLWDITFWTRWFWGL